MMVLALALLADAAGTAGAVAAPDQASGGSAPGNQWSPDPAALSPPDFGPMHEAVQKCDRDAMAKLNKAEPHRRAEFAGAIYAEQVAIAQSRANLDSTTATSAAGRASLEAGRAQLDARQKELDDTKAVEKAWRDGVEELRGDFLANCDTRKR